jgi:hypothetical protein
MWRRGGVAQEEGRDPTVCVGAGIKRVPTLWLACSAAALELEREDRVN